MKNRLSLGGIRAAFAVFMATCLNIVPIQVAAQTRPLELNVAVASAYLAYTPFWLALADNMFEKNGLKLKVAFDALNTGSAMLVSGQTDVFLTNAFAGIRVAKQGKPVSYLFDVIHFGGDTLSVIARKGIKTMDELVDMGDKCKLGTLTAGSSHYAYTVGVMKAYKLKCQVMPVAQPAMLLASIQGNHFDAAVVTPGEAYQVAEADKANLLIDPLKLSRPQADAIYPFRHPAMAAFGIKDNLATKREATVAFIKTLREANKRLADMNGSELATKLRQALPNVFGPQQQDALELQWKLLKPALPTGDKAGALAEREWKTLLQAAGTYWNLADLSPNDPTVQHDRMVDMSYFDAAK